MKKFILLKNIYYILKMRVSFFSGIGQENHGVQISIS